jgi:ABC-type multidrug transport system fused ATPase/permease subunit
MGGALCGILPIVSSFISPSEVGGDVGGNFFGKVLSIYKHIIPESEYKQMISLGIFFVLMLINATVKFIIVKVNSGLTVKLTCDCRMSVYNGINIMKLSVIQQYAKGMLTQLLITETRSVYAVFKQALMVITTFFNILVVVILLIMLSWKLSLVLFFGSILFAWTNIYIIRSIKKLGKTALVFRAELMNKVTEAIWGLKQIKLIQAEKAIMHQLEGASRQSENINRRMVVKNGFQEFLSGSYIFGIVFALICFWRYFPVFSGGISEIAGLITFLILIGRLGPYFASISKAYGSIYAKLPAVSRISEFLSVKDGSEVGGNYRPINFLKDRISLRDVYFGYSPGELVLSGVDLEIKKGSYIGIKGRSGGGKSTMLDLFIRINDTSKGGLFIDDINIKEYKLSYLRSHIGMVSQNFFLFNTSIRGNLLLAKPSATEEELVDALDKAGLLEFVNSLEEKLGYHVGNNGEELSEGQRQRICLATIFLRNPEIIILDEVTSSVDKETENHILASLRELHHHGKTIISCSHRESSLIGAESVYWLNDGRLTLLSEKAAPFRM